MAIRYAVATGNWSSTATWNGCSLPTSADDVFAINFTVTINQYVTVKSLDYRATTGVTAGGNFIILTTITIVCDTITSGNTSLISITSGLITVTITANSLTTGGTQTIATVNSTILNIIVNGNIFSNNQHAFLLNNIGNFTLNGNAISNSNNGAITMAGAGIIVVNGYCQGGTIGAAFQSQSTNAFSSATITKAISVNNCLAGVNNVNSPCTVTVKEIEQGVFGAVPIQGYVRLSTASGAFYKGVTTGSSTRTLSDPADIAGQVPAQTDVRFGVSYQGGSKTGSAYIPSAASVGFGVPVDNTTGTAALTPASVWNAATSSLTTSGSIGERLKNASTVDTTGDQLAALL